MVNGLPSWVQQPGASSPMTGPFQVNGAGAQQSSNFGMRAPSAPAQQQTNPNAWDGIGPNTNRDQNQVSNVGTMFGATSPQMQNLPPQVQQFMNMFNGMNGQGFTGFQPVSGNPFANLGSNVNQWGANQQNGIYGGT